MNVPAEVIREVDSLAHLAAHHTEQHGARQCRVLVAQMLLKRQSIN